MCIYVGVGQEAAHHCPACWCSESVDVMNRCIVVAATASDSALYSSWLPTLAALWASTSVTTASTL